MTAFAAILSRGAPRPDPHHTQRIAAALESTYGTPAGAFTIGECALLLAPLHPNDPNGPLIEPVSGVAAAGQVWLEGGADLAERLGAPTSEGGLTIVLRAYLRWGQHCTERLAGEFAFVLWDPRERALICARDGLGVRLLYVAETPGALVYTNTLGAAVAHPGIAASLDHQALVNFLATGSLRPGRTAYRAVRQLPAGHTLRLTRDGSTLSRHWWFPQPTRIRRPPSDEETLRQYRAVLGAATAERIRAGRASILLSGGLDSTSIAASARAAAPSADVRAFTAVYKRIADSPDPPYAAAAAHCLGIPWTPVNGDAHDALHAVWHGPPAPLPQDEPSLTDWRTLVAAAASHSTIALYGEDGDSLFLAPGFTALWRGASVPTLVAAVCRYAIECKRLPYIGLRVRERVGLRQRATAGRRPVWLTPDAVRIHQQDGDETWAGLEPEPLPRHPTRPDTQKRLCAGVSEYLCVTVSPDLTRERLELTCPLLDTRVIQFVMDVPAIPWCQNKRLPRTAYRGILPDDIVQRPKAGIAGLDRELVRSWQDRANAPHQELAPPLDSWIQWDPWCKALRDADVATVSAAWRVLQLDGWLRRRHELAPSTATPCTP